MSLWSSRFKWKLDQWKARWKARWEAQWKARSMESSINGKLDQSTSGSAMLVRAPGVHLLPFHGKAAKGVGYKAWWRIHVTVVAVIYPRRWALMEIIRRRPRPIIQNARLELILFTQTSSNTCVRLSYRSDLNVKHIKIEIFRMVEKDLNPYWFLIWIVSFLIIFLVSTGICVNLRATKGFFDITLFASGIKFWPIK